MNEIKPVETKKKRSPVGLIILIICIIVALGFAAIALQDNDESSSQKIEFNNSREVIKTFNFGNRQDKKIITPSGDYIARIYIRGVIEEGNKTYNQKWLLDTIKDLERDNNNKGIILFIDSPGGAVYESDEAYLALSHYQSTHKPVWAYMTHMAASGAYYISCGAEYICANRNTLTGSIGVIAGQSIDMTGLMNNIGIKSKTFTAGKNKNMLNYNSPLTEEQEAIMQSIADECYDQFTTIVALNRRIDKAEVAKLADGRIYTANQALNLKLVDKVCSYEDAVNAMKAKYQFSGVEVFDYKYEPKTTWQDLFTSAISSIKPLTQSKEQTVIEMISPTMKYPAYLYK